MLVQLLGMSTCPASSGVMAHPAILAICSDSDSTTTTTQLATSRMVMIRYGLGVLANASFLPPCLS